MSIPGTGDFVTGYPSGPSKRRTEPERSQVRERYHADVQISKSNHQARVGGAQVTLCTTNQFLLRIRHSYREMPPWTFFLTNHEIVNPTNHRSVSPKAIRVSS